MPRVLNKDNADWVTLWDKLLGLVDCIQKFWPAVAALNSKCSFWFELMKHAQMTKIDNRLTWKLRMTKKYMLCQPF
jgi:hypothetical protein